MKHEPKYLLAAILATMLYSPVSFSDTVTDWNTKAVDIIGDAIKPPDLANRAVALVQTSVYVAVNSINKRYPATEPVIEAPADASVAAAIAAANRHILNELLPKSQATIDESYNAVISSIPEGKSRDAGIAVGTQAAESVLAMRAKDKTGIPETYRPLTTPGTYVPTVTPVASTWSMNRLPWSLTSADQFRPDPPPALDSEQWATDYNEIKEVGALNSKTRTADQSAAAQFWISTSPKTFQPIIRSVTDQKGRDLTRNARLFAMATQAIDDSIIAVFEAKYHYQFWRPMTAIRNGDQDNNDATERVANWKPMVNNPMHPEYPCAHCIVASAIGTALKADLGSDPAPVLSTASTTADGTTRSWKTIDTFVQEVSDARVWEGVHYRNSTEVGKAMGKQVAEQVTAGYPALLK
ncbi:MAG: vanadium-dependent haloperoxidase [Thiolinea sp.]